VAAEADSGDDGGDGDADEPEADEPEAAAGSDEDKG